MQQKNTQISWNERVVKFFQINEKSKIIQKTADKLNLYYASEMSKKYSICIVLVCQKERQMAKLR